MYGIVVLRCGEYKFFFFFFFVVDKYSVMKQSTLELNSRVENIFLFKFSCLQMNTFGACGIWSES